MTKTGTFTVPPPPLDPRFTVTSRSKGANACAIDGDDGHLDCELDGRGSFGSISRWLWTLRVGDEHHDHDTSIAVTEMSPTCSFLGGGTLRSDETVDMVVELRLVGKDGTRSSTLSRTIKLYPQRHCGY